MIKLLILLKNGCSHRQNFDLNSYDDRIDTSPEISLFECYTVRQSKTGKTLFWHPTLENKKVEKSGYVSITYITLGDVISALKEMDIDFFKFIDSTHEKEHKRLEEIPFNLSNIIHSINQYNGWFYT